ncbi:MAG: protoheme IX farnesyltransferase, partial [Planctomycetes bacterium]|nr:protoheme IX farnesyltransferase [Planctomycetota bacterium]
CAILNQVVEVDVDGKMERTKNRPLPTGRVRMQTAKRAGWLSAVLGIAWLGFFLNPLSAWLAFVMLVSYVFVYTPLKQVTELNTIVGAVPGALPLLIGWAAGGQGLNLMAGILFAVLFFWQLPHFMSIAWLYREDYERGGMKMLPAQLGHGSMFARQSIHWAITLLLASVLPTIFGFASVRYFYVALSLSLIFLGLVLRFSKKQNERRARVVLYSSLLYLPLLIGALVWDLMG